MKDYLLKHFFVLGVILMISTEVHAVQPAKTVNHRNTVFRSNYDQDNCEIDGIRYTVTIEYEYDYDRDQEVAIAYSATVTGSDLAEVNIPESIRYNNIDYPVTKINSYCFNGSESLEKIILPNSITEIGASAFAGCKIKEITIPESVTTIGASAFQNCSKFEMVEFDHTTELPSIGASAFASVNYALLDLTKLPEAPQNSRQLGGGYFYLVEDSGTCGENVIWRYGTNSGGAIYISGTGDMTNYRYESEQPWRSYKSMLRCVYFQEGITNIGDYAFTTSNVSTISLPTSIKRIGKQAFAWTDLRRRKEVPSYTPNKYPFNIPEGVTEIGDFAFQQCWGFTSLSIPSTVTNIGNGIVAGCSQLEEITVNEANETFDSRDNCNAIIETESNKLLAVCSATEIPATTAIIGSYVYYLSTFVTFSIPETINRIEDSAFLSSSSLESVYIPKSVVYIAQNAFAACNRLNSIEVDGENTVYDSRNNCNAIIETASNTLMIGIKTSTIPDGIEVIGEKAFASCYDLPSVVFPTSIKTIGRYAFQNCRNLTTMVLPKNITEIGNLAFASCSALKYIDMNDCDNPRDITVSRSSGIFGGVAKTTTIYLPGGKGHSDGGEPNVVIGRICTGTFSITDGKLFESITEFTANQINYDRTFTSDVPCTVCLPFTASTSNVSGGTFYSFAGVSDNTVIMNEVTGNILANTPYLYLPTNSTMEVSGSVEVAIVNEETSATTERGEWSFCGTYDKKAWATDGDFEGSVIYGFAANSYGDNVNPGDFVKVKAGANSFIQPFRAYLKYTAINGARASADGKNNDTQAPTKLSVKLVSASPTDVQGIISNCIVTDNIYDLNGRRINGSERLSKGIYIKNGKKLIIK